MNKGRVFSFLNKPCEPETLKFTLNAALKQYQMVSLERERVENAPQIGHDLLFHIPRPEPVARIVLYREKHYDGTGFPQDKVAGEDMPLGARMLKLLHDHAFLEGEGVVKKRAFDTMSARTRTYDPVLLEKCFMCFETFLTNAISAERPVLPLVVHELQPGVVLVSDIKTKGDILLVAAGNRLTEVMISRLHNYSNDDGIKEPIYVQ